MKKLCTPLFLSLLFFAFRSTPAQAQVDHLVISQVYGGGGNAGSTYTNDFIEIFNPTGASVDVSGWSVQYASSSGSSWNLTPLTGVISAGGYLLVQEAAGSGGTTPLPAPDVTGTLALSATAGKVALVSSSVALTGTCPSGGSLVDFIGFGSASCFEGTGACSALTNTTAALRADDGCTDSGNNTTDFTTGAPAPRNSASPVHFCGVVAMNVSASTGTQASEPSTNGTFTIHFSVPTAASADVNFSYTGTAVFGSDYTISYSAGSTSSTAATGTLTVPAGTSSVTVTVTPVDDALVEGDETVSLALSAPTGGYSVTGSPADMVLTDDDVSTVAVAAGSNAAEAGSTGSFVVTLSDPAPASGVTVQYTLNGTATANTDYTDPQGGSILIPGGSTTGTITLDPADDALYEGTENIGITLTSASAGFAITVASASIDLADNDTPPAIVINELYGGGGNSGADFKNDFIELYNPGATDVNLSGWSVQYGSATGTTWSGKTVLTGVIHAHGYYLIQESAGTGGTTDLPAPDDIGNVSMSGTAGKVALVASASTLPPGCPAPGSYVDLAGFGATANCFESAPAPAPSNTTSVERSPKGFDSNNNSTDFVAGTPTPKNSVIDLTPPVIASMSPADDATGLLTSFTATINFSENILKGAGTIVLKKVSDGSTVKTIDVSTPAITVSGSTVSFDINSLAFNTAYYFEISSGAFVDANDNTFAGLSGTADWNFSTAATPPAGTLGSTYHFNTCTGSLTDGFTQFNMSGAQTWGCTAFGRDPDAPSGTTAFPNGVQINGFANGINNTNTDWLISPSFDLTSTAFPLLSFWSRTAFTGAQLVLKVSTDYSGTGDPNLATWTDLNGKFPSEVSDTWGLSENINLSAYKSAHTYFAFVYTSTTDDGARWTLDDILVNNSLTPPPPSLTLSSTDIQYTFVAGGSTADKTFSFTGNDLTGDVTLSSTGAFLLSRNGTSFGSSVTYTQAEADNTSETVFVRFAPDAANQNYTGLVSINTDGIATHTINLKGSSVDPASTLEVMNWNMEWFGSSSLGPSDNNLQEQNASSVINAVGADLYGLVEIVDESRLQQVVNSLNATYGAGTYSYVICNYGSHVNPPEPGGSPLGEVQKEAFVYKTALFSNITTRPLIFNEDVNSPSYNFWASGRYPFMMTADVTLNCVKKTIRFILIHAKANTAPTATAYDRRQSAANELHDTLQTYFAGDNIVILGDFNDDLDQSITAGFTTTSYSAFTTDPDNFFSPTLALSLAGKKSTVSYNDVIDHVLLSNEMEPFYMPGSATILTDVASTISKYGTTTTDHYPVFTRYVFPNTTAPVVTSCTASVSYCSVAAGMYTIPAFAATDDCGDSLSYSYVITGATERSGTSADASGAFNPGTSTITWTAADSWGNVAHCTTTVTINASPAVAIPDAYAVSSGADVNTVYIGYGPAAILHVQANASQGLPGYTYSWAAGTGLAIDAGTGTQQTVSIHATGSGDYTSTLNVTVTDSKGCTAIQTVTIHVRDVRGGNKNDKVVVCHQGYSLTIAAPAVAGHLDHGDYLGDCSGTEGDQGGKPAELLRTVLSNFPNPFHESTTIKYELSKDCQVSLKIYNVFGQAISTLFEGNKKAGSYTLNYSSSKLAKGVYFCKITAVSNDQSSIVTTLLLAE